MTEPIDLPPEIEQVADLLGKQPPGVRDLFRYALVLAMIDYGKARITGTRNEGNREYLTVQTCPGRKPHPSEGRFQASRHCEE